MADAKISALTADTSPTSDDLVVTVNDPAGTPVNRKVTLGNIATLMASLAAFSGVYQSTAGHTAKSVPVSDTGTLADVVMAASTILARLASGGIVAATPAQLKTLLAIANTDVSGLGTLSTQSGTFSGTSSGTNTGDQTITLTGDVTGSGTGSFAATLKNTGGGAAGPTGSASVAPIVTVDAQGRVTALSSASIAIAESAVTNLTTDLAAKEPILVPTAVKTSNYTAAVGDLVKCDSSGGAFAVTLPTAPADKSRIEVKQVSATVSTVTVNCGGSDVFNRAGGATAATLSLIAQSQTYQYQATGAIWLVTENSTPLSQLDLRFAPITGIPESSVTNLTTDLAAKAPLASPTFTGTPLSTTAAQGTNTTQLATTAMVQSEVTLLAPKASPTFTGTVTTPAETIVTAATLAANPGAILNLGNAATVTYNNSGGVWRGVRADPTVVLAGGTGASAGAYVPFASVATLSNSGANSLSAVTSGAVLLDQTTYRADTNAGLGAGGAYTVRSVPTYSVLSTGTFTSGDFFAVYSGGVINTGVTLDSVTGVKVADWTGSGTPVVQYGIDIDAIAKGTTAVGIRNLATQRQVGRLTAGADSAATWAIHVRRGNNADNAIGMDVSTTGPTAPGSNGAGVVSIFKGVTNYHFLITFNDAGTTRYKSLQLNSTGVTWVNGTAVPA